MKNNRYIGVMLFIIQIYFERYSHRLEQGESPAIPGNAYLLIGKWLKW